MRFSPLSLLLVVVVPLALLGWAADRLLPTSASSRDKPGAVSLGSAETHGVAKHALDSASGTKDGIRTGGSAASSSESIRAETVRDVASGSTDGAHRATRPGASRERSPARVRRRSGGVLAESGRPLPEAKIVLREHHSGFLPGTTTRVPGPRDGRVLALDPGAGFEFDEYEGFVYELVVAAEEQATVSVVATGTSFLGLTLEAARTFVAGLVDAGTGAPVKSASVQVLQGSVSAAGSSDDKGRVVLGGLGSTAILVRVTHPDYVAVERVFPGPPTSALEIPLERGVTISGIVVAGNETVSAHVELTDRLNGNSLGTVQTGADGHFFLEAPGHGGDLAVRVSSAPFATTAVPVVWPAETTAPTPLLVDLAEPIASRIEIRDPAGDPVEGAVVSVRFHRSEVVLADALGRTDAAGTVQVAGLDPRGRMDVTVFAPGFAAIPLVNLVREQFLQLAIVLIPASKIEGSVVDGVGLPRPHAHVEAEVPGDSAAGRYAATTADAAGRFVLDGLLPGSYTVRALSPGFDVAEIAGVLVPEGATVTDLRLVVPALLEFSLPPPGVPR